MVLEWKNGNAFSSKGKVREFEQTGKVRENRTKYWKTGEFQKNVICYILVKFKQITYYLLKLNMFSVKKKTKREKKYWKMEKILEKSGTFVIPEKWEPC